MVQTCFRLHFSTVCSFPRPPGFRTPKGFTCLTHYNRSTHFTLVSYKLNVNLLASFSAAAITDASLTRKSASCHGPRLIKTDIVTGVLRSASLVKDIFILVSYDITVTVEIGSQNLMATLVPVLTVLLQPVLVLGSLLNDDTSVSPPCWSTTYLALNTFSSKQT